VNGGRRGLPGVSYLQDGTTVTGELAHSMVLRRWQNCQLIDVFDIGAGGFVWRFPRWVQAWLSEWGSNVA
jgi:hypothetical protein